MTEGLRSRVALREAAGWLGHAHTWIHPRDLALRDMGVTGSHAAAARAGREELASLLRAEAAGAALARTARSHLPQAVDHVLRSPVVTARGLAESLSITPQASLRLVGQLLAAGVIREATGRAAWRAFSTP